ncbi:EipB family protein [Terasakiella sp. A23]|uniref:EipB family protein n=1 Tax=Terasakiella sp. FCG-A23 TaxID=3080561 RepID=UPI0029555D35|nr:DUF1849 family protein [Terasakiella sp. A23]
MLKKILIGLGLIVAIDVQAADSPLRSHDATYLMKQVVQYDRDWSPLESATGLLRYKFRRTCDGWTVEHYNAMQMEYENGQQANMVWNYTSWEAMDGSHLRFRTQMKRNDEVISKFSGEARHEADKTTVTYSRPSGKRADMPANTYFPTRHMRESLEMAEKGETFFNSPYFDGSGEELDFDLNAVMTPYKGKPLVKVEDQVLPNVKSWDMQLAFFDPKAQESIADMEITARYRRDGVATRLIQDFGDFVLEGQLVEFAYSDEPQCN